MGEPFVRKNYPNSDDEVMEEEDIWDDTLLIQAYNKAVDMAKEKIAKRMNLENGIDTSKGNESPSQPSPTKKTETPAKNDGSQKVGDGEASFQWLDGMPCRAIYSEDGQEYEAIIRCVYGRRGTCDVVYVGYNNEEEVELASLKSSKGEKARKAQEMRSTKMSSHSTRGVSYGQEPAGNPHSFSGEDLGIIPPPPPPNVLAHFPKDESDALSAMLMAWYMSGYHTGYYQGFTRSKSSGCAKGECMSTTSRLN